MREIFVLLILSFVFMDTYAQRQIRGRVVDEKKVTLYGAVVYFKSSTSTGTTTDYRGEFELHAPKKADTLIVSFIGFKNKEIAINKKTSDYLDITLVSDAVKLNEVVVSANSVNDRLEVVQIGVEKIELEALANAPVIFGENDLMKSVTLLPGIKSQSEGSSNYQVRGGTASQNLVLLDDAPIYSPGHVMGIFSVFNDDAISNASFYKGMMPSSIGGGISSVFDISSRSGDFRKMRGGINVGLLATKGYFTTPIIADKMSFFVSARRSYFDIFLKPLEDFKDDVLYFYDINTSLSAKLGKNDRLTASFFHCFDHFEVESLFTMTWGNIAGSLDWFHRYNDRFIHNTNVYITDYDTDVDFEMVTLEQKTGSFIKTYGLKHNFNLQLNQTDVLDFGLHMSYINNNSLYLFSDDETDRDKARALESAIWVDYKRNLFERLNLRVGLRLNSFLALGGSEYHIVDSDYNILESFDTKKGEIVESYLNLEPRLSFNYRLADNSSIKAGYSRTAQNIYALENTSMSIPYVRYTMASNNIKPLLADQFSLGYIYVTPSKGYELSTETYYKRIHNVYDYRDGDAFYSSFDLEEIILEGDGRSYGMEFLAKRNLGRLTGWLGYTLAWSENKINGINNSKWYNAANDIRHDINLVGMYDLSDKWRMSFSWVYNTGKALTAPSAKYKINEEIIYYYNERSGYRAPAYHRLDLSFMNSKKKKNYTREWSLGVYNLYNKANPYIISFEDDEASLSGTKAEMIYLYGILPSVSFSIIF